jgi:hypothetical protein
MIQIRAGATQITQTIAVDHGAAEPRSRLPRVPASTKQRIDIHLSLTYSWSGVIGVVLFVSVAWVFYISPVHYLSDSGFSLLMDEALIHNWTPNMLGFQVPRGHGGVFINDGYPWNIKIIKGRLLYVYPWGSSLLSLPVVAIFNADGFKIAPHLTGYKYDYRKELRMQVIITTGLCALMVWIAFLSARYFLPLKWSLAIALTAAFGTPIWSSASRSLWPATWAVFLMMVAIWILLRGSIRPFLLGTVLAWSCLARPTMIAQVAAIGVYVLVTYGRRFFLRYIAGGICSAIPVCGMMWLFTGGLFSVAYPSVLFDFPHQFWLRLYGVLLSPSRGFLVFSPMILVILYLVVRYWRVLPERRLVILGLVNIGVYLMVLCSYFAWWGGNSYGPRLLLEVVPWCVLLAILAVTSFVEDSGLTRRRRLVTIGIGAFAVALNVAMNAPGALVESAINWRSYDTDHLEVLWDWRDPQFLCWIQRLQN